MPQSRLQEHQLLLCHPEYLEVMPLQLLVWQGMPIEALVMVPVLTALATVEVMAAMEEDILLVMAAMVQDMGQVMVATVHMEEWVMEELALEETLKIGKHHLY